MPIINDQVPDADEVMNALGSQFQDTAQMIFNADYIGFDSRLTNSTTPDLKNVLYSTFTSDDADVNFGFFYDSSTDLYETPDLSAVNEYVVVEASSLSSLINQNDVRSVQINAGKWLVYCTSGTDAVHRAQILKTLFSDNKILTFTSVTAVKTSHANDVDKRAHKTITPLTGNGDNTTNNTGTFADTSTNANCSSWSNLVAEASPATCQWEMASGNTLNSVGASSTSNELGTDTSGDEKNNPADCQGQLTGGSLESEEAQVIALILCSGGITWVVSGIGDPWTDVDFFTDNSIPDMTAADTLVNEGVSISTLIFKDTITSTDNAIAVINSTIDATSSEQISISANGGSNYTDVNNAEIARPTAGTALWRRIVITRADLSKEDIVTEQAVKHSFY